MDIYIPFPSSTSAFFTLFINKITKISKYNHQFKISFKDLITNLYGEQFGYIINFA